jgi:hypothetical protein
MIVRERTRRETKGGLGGDQFKNRFALSSWDTVRSRSCDIARCLLDWNVFGELPYDRRELGGSKPFRPAYPISALWSEQRWCGRALVSCDHSVHFLAFNHLLALGQEMGSEASARLFVKDLE